MTAGYNVALEVYDSILEGNRFGIYSGGTYTSLAMNVVRVRFSKNEVGVTPRIATQGVVSITESIIISNEVGIDASYVFGTLRVSKCDIEDNLEHAIVGANVLNGYGDVDVAADSNWWGTSSEVEINSRILDCNDDLEIGCVMFKPAATSRFGLAP